LSLNADNTFSLSHQYADNASYTVTVVVNNGGANGTGTAGVTANNVAPVVNAGPDGPATSGVAFVSSGSFTDPGADTWTATVDYGDGSGVQALALNANKTFNLSKVYTLNGQYTVTVRVTDDDSGTHTDTAVVTVTGGPTQQSYFLSDLTPTFASNGWGPYEKDKSNGEQAAGDGVPIKLNGTTYTKGLGVHATSDLRYNLAGQYASFTASIGVDDEVGSAGSVVFQVWCDGIKLYDSGTMTGSTATKNVSVNVTGKNELKLIVTNAGNGSGSDHADWANAKITKSTPAGLAVNAGSGGTINEGSTFNSSGSFSDPGAGTWTATVNYGDGSGAQALTLNADKTFALSHQYSDNGSFTVTVTVDNGSTSASSTAPVTVNNAPPAVNAGSDGTIAYNTAFTSSGSFVDPGTDTWTATVNYGDGTGVQALTLNADKSFTLDHVYVAGGVYTVTVTVVDDDNASGSDTAAVTVNGPAPTSQYLSDLTPTFATNGWGPYEKDQSNGEQASGDGAPLRINGVFFARGLGIHASSDLRFALNGQYTSFLADVGVDDETGGEGSVRFQVYGDSTLLYDSGTVLAGPARSVNVDVTGRTTLRLVVSDSGDGNYFDHADWANARVTRPASALAQSQGFSGDALFRQPAAPQDRVDALLDEIDDYLASL
ncbi:MAG: NPCBM/NEW2 domain-containing protein, partial [Tepidisphaeraceae bacterium]